MASIQCPRCDRPFEAAHHLQKYCRREDCGLEPRTCENCGSEFMGEPVRRFCGLPCYRADLARRNSVDLDRARRAGKKAGEIRGRQLRNESSGAKTLRRVLKILSEQPFDPDVWKDPEFLQALSSENLEDRSLGYAKVDGHIHRRVAEIILGRALKPGEVVHHEDMNKKNNHPNNLIVFSSQAEHARHHKLGHPGKVSSCDCGGTRLERILA